MTSIKLKLPDLDGNPTFVEGKDSLVLIGANGSGKTRMSILIEGDNQNYNFHRISAQKSLNMPTITRPSDLTSSQANFLYGHPNINDFSGKYRHRWKNVPAIHLLDDFSQLMEFLITDHYEKTIKYREEHMSGNTSFKNTTYLDTIKNIWEDVITNKVLNITAGKIEVSNKNSPNETFNGSDMSDGEREVFYFIGEALCVPENTVIIIDEPENHLHRAILIRLWNSIEAARPDCMFIYITHDLDFAVSRNNSQIIWVKDMPQKNIWDYELLTSSHFPIDELSLEIRGSRQDVLLVEGTSDSIDKPLYSLIFKEYNVIFVESCERVISFTKAFNELEKMHYCKVRGIIDRDRRSDTEIGKLNQSGIFCPEVAEIENLFLLPKVIEVVALDLHRNKQEIEDLLERIHQKTFEFLSKEIEAQALSFTKKAVQRKVNEVMNQKINKLNEYRSAVESIPQSADIDSTYKKVYSELSKIIEEQDYFKALKVINNKGLLPYTGVLDLFNGSKKVYIDYVMRLLSSPSVSEELITVFKQYIKIH